MTPLFLPGKENSAVKAGGNIPDEAASPRKETPTSASTSSTSYTTSSESLLQRLGDVAFDFGVVAVYSCPNSCVKKHQNIVENNNKLDDIGDMKSSVGGESNIHFSRDFTNDTHRATTITAPTTSPSPSSSSSSSLPSNSSTLNFECILVQGPSDF